MTREQSARNYYEVLGLRPTAGPEEIKGAYRFLAMAFHPDRYPDPVQKGRAEAHFKVVQEAYGVLSDPQRRRAYDAGPQRANGAVPGGPGPRDPVAALLGRLGGLVLALILDGVGRRAPGVRPKVQRAAWEALLGQLEDLAEALDGSQSGRGQRRRRRPRA